MNSREVNYVSQRLSLRPPQRRSLEILDRVCELAKLEKGADSAEALKAIQAEFPTVAEFERDFPSMCFALATGVGKTRLMGAFISYLHKATGVRHFFVLAPNLTIYNKLIADFTPNTPKYVFQGIDSFATRQPVLITGDNYEQGHGIRNESTKGQQALWDTGEVHVNIFNISKINAEVRGDKAPRIKRLSEYIGQSYFDYLAGLPDLVLLMDESHRYRAEAGMRAINELKPILGLELTATPQIEKAGKSEPFKNVIYSYPLSEAMKDGFVKEPAVATRENFKKSNYDDAGLERLKLEDGIRIHEDTKVKLEVYAKESGRPLVKPFMLVVAEDTTHAEALKVILEKPDFFQGHYKDKVITVHSSQRGEEKDENVELLMSVERTDNPVEVVIHVNMLKEGWDVTNLYTIVPLRAANSKTLVEQSIGRGLRLPYGSRTGTAAVDRLTIVSHDRFQEIIDEANKPGSIIRTGVVIGKDIPLKHDQIITARPVSDIIFGFSAPGEPLKTDKKPIYGPLFDLPGERAVAMKVAECIEVMSHNPHFKVQDLLTPEVQKSIVEQVERTALPAQGELEVVGKKTNTVKTVEKASRAYVEHIIQIPKIVVQPKGEITAGYDDFDLDVSAINFQAVDMQILIQHLRTAERERLASGDGVIPEKRPEDYLIRGLVNYDDINYDTDSVLLYKLAGQAVKKLQSNLGADDDLPTILQYHQRGLVEVIHGQMQGHYQHSATEYEANVTRSFTVLRSGILTLAAGDRPVDFRAPVADKQGIRGMAFTGFLKCLYDYQKFQSDPERRFAVLLEDEGQVLRWFKPGPKVFKIYIKSDAPEYEPDFVVETKDTKYVCEVKDVGMMADPEVQEKAKAGASWCQSASKFEKEIKGKPWIYVLIPDSAITGPATFKALVEQYRL